MYIIIVLSASKYCNLSALVIKFSDYFIVYSTYLIWCKIAKSSMVQVTLEMSKQWVIMISDIKMNDNMAS